MSEQLEPGMKVECVFDAQHRYAPFHATAPALGSVYTVREVKTVTCPQLGLSANVLLLVEIKNAPHNDEWLGRMEPPFLVQWFRPIRKREQNIEQFRALVRNAKAEDFLFDEVDA